MFASASQRSLALSTSFALVAISSAVRAGNVHVVSPSGPYTQIQPAIDAASDHDTILVKSFPTPASSYDGFVLNGKSLVIVGDPGVGQVVKVLGEINVQSVPAGGMAVLASIEGRAPTGFSPPRFALLASSNPGSIRVESCQFFGYAYATSAVMVSVGTDVQLISTDIKGWDGIWGDFASPKGQGLHAIQSTLRLYGCTLTGGDGGTDPNPDPDVGTIYGGDAGDALQASHGIVFAADCTFQGGDGGNGSLAWCREGAGGDGGSGGDGIQCSGPMSGAPLYVYTAGCSMQGGDAGLANLGMCPGIDGAPGLPVREVNAGHWVNFANAPARYISGTPLARENANVTLEARGATGDRVYVRVETVPTAQAFPFTGSHSPLGSAEKPRWIFLGTIPASGTLSTTIPAGPLRAGVQGEWMRLRSTFVVSSGAVAESNDIVVAIVDSAF